ncbi:ABC-three component system protein [Dyadobacter sp. LHD-138]|uniref:ABC-three component system protein n=1 Tax=Dyadobacter sp. LHD-138 TaxID=3071413 RepID=UPI0027E06702|nr:ABC-three component system protein [Dyadobacter sp. LHD-138]MDQ6481832.1 hypothetical protein [Dyadobacter sp. LHD-138]
MTPEILKTYLVLVNEGSGCLFQPMISDSSYTYILTAKHLFEGIKLDEDGNPHNFTAIDGDLFPIRRLVLNNETWSEESISFKFVRNETYFPSDTADAAILKVSFIDGFNKIFQSDISHQTVGYSLIGYPELYRLREIGNRNAIYHITHLNAPGAHSYNAQLENINFAREHIAGMSGGGIVKITQEGISIIGIQSEVTHQNFAGGQIEFVPIEYFNQIVALPDNLGKLAPLHPPYYNSFSFLRDEAFILEVDAIDENDIAGARTTLRNKAEEIVQSNITPKAIKDLFEKRLLILEEETACFSYKNIWIAWLEFLTILKIVKYEKLEYEMLSEVFDSYRLKYIDGYGWTDVRKEFGKSDYVGLKPDSVIFVSSKTPPKTTYKIPKGKLIDISTPYDKRGFKADKGIDPFTSFDFVHLDYFKVKCIIEKLMEYKAMTEQQLLDKLKIEYHDLFG